MSLNVLDALGAQKTLSTTTDSGGVNLVGSTALTDPITGQKATVAQFHNSDNQSPGSSGYGLLTGGVAQLLNVAGNIDRQRETGTDGVPAAGIVSGATSFAMQFKTSSAAAIAIGTQVVTPGAMSGTVGGVPWSIQQGSVLTVDAGASKETIVVTAITSTTFTAVFSKSHAATPVTITGFVFNQGRDAAGENDGASGSGTAIAAEYEFNGGDPSGGNFDRARSLNAKAFTTQTISAGGGAASTSLTLGGNTGLQPGMKVLLYKSATFPNAGTFESVNVDLSYTPGSNTVPLASAIINAVGSYDTIAYDGFAALGPQLNGFLPFGVGIEEECLYDPVSGKYFIERAATQDSMPPQNVVAENPVLWNGNSMDRQRGNFDMGTLASFSSATSAGAGPNLTNYNGRGVQIGVNITAITGTSPTFQVFIEGWDSASGVYYSLLTSAALTATGFTLLTVYPGLTATANVVANQILPRTWRVRCAIGGTTPSVTASVGGSVIV